MVMLTHMVVVSLLFTFHLQQIQTSGLSTQDI